MQISRLTGGANRSKLEEICFRFFSVGLDGLISTNSILYRAVCLQSHSQPPICCLGQLKLESERGSIAD